MYKFILMHSPMSGEKFKAGNKKTKICNKFSK